MSAFMCEDEHFRQLGAWLVCGDRSHYEWIGRRVGYTGQTYNQEGIATHIANVLKEENARSLNARYRDRTEFSEPVNPLLLGEIDRMSRVDLGRIAGATRCYDYQACESADYDETPAKAIVTLIYQEIAASIPGARDCWGAPAKFDQPAPQLIGLSSLFDRLD